MDYAEPRSELYSDIPEIEWQHQWGRCGGYWSCWICRNIANKRKRDGESNDAKSE